jgi:hypothetical protein
MMDAPTSDEMTKQIVIKPLTRAFLGWGLGIILCWATSSRTSNPFVYSLALATPPLVFGLFSPGWRRKTYVMFPFRIVEDFDNDDL